MSCDQVERKDSLCVFTKKWCGCGHIGRGKDGAEVEVEEAPTGADADKTDAPPATEDVSRLSGFGQISGKKNSLDRKASRPTQRSSVTGQTGAKDRESEEGSSVVDL